MKIKTNEASGPVLDWAVAIALGHKPFPAGNLNVGKFGPLFGKTTLWAAIGLTRAEFSSRWAQGGPIIDRMMDDGLHLVRSPQLTTAENKCRASLDTPNKFYYGPTPLIAAMRCFVASKLGDEAEVPDELI